MANRKSLSVRVPANLLVSLKMQAIEEDCTVTALIESFLHVVHMKRLRNQRKKYEKAPKLADGLPE